MNERRIDVVDGADDRSFPQVMQEIATRIDEETGLDANSIARVRQTLGTINVDLPTVDEEKQIEAIVADEGFEIESRSIATPTFDPDFLRLKIIDPLRHEGDGGDAA